MAERGCGLGRTRVRIGGKPVRKAVGFLDRVIELLERADDRDRAERLLVHDARALRHVGEYGRLEEIALVADTPPAGFTLGTFGDGVADEGLHGVEAARMRNRPHAGAFLEAVADFYRLCGTQELAHELVVRRLLHHEPRRCDTDLAGVAELGGAEHL